MFISPIKKRLFSAVLMGLVAGAGAQLKAVTTVDATTSVLTPYTSTTAGYSSTYGTTLLLGNPGANLLTPSSVSIGNTDTNWSGSLPANKTNPPTTITSLPVVTFTTGPYAGSKYFGICLDFNDAADVDIVQMMLWSAPAATATNTIGSKTAYTNNSVSGNYLSDNSSGISGAKLLFKMDVDPNPASAAANKYTYATQAAYTANTTLLNSTNGIVIRNVTTGSSTVEFAFLVPIYALNGLSTDQKIYMGVQTGGLANSGGDEQIGFIGSFIAGGFLATNSTINASYFGTGNSIITNGSGADVTSAVTQTLTFSDPTATQNTINLQGKLNLSEGETTIALGSNNGKNITLTFDSLVRTGCATANFSVLDAVTQKINFSLAPSPTGQVLGQQYFFNGSDYAVYDTTLGALRAVSYSGTPDTNTAVSAGGTTMGAVSGKDVLLNAAVTAQTTLAINTVKIAGDFNITLGASQILTTNGVLKTTSAAAGSTISGASGAALQAASGQDLVVRVDNASDSLTISVPITANGSNRFVKSGPGTVVLTGASTYTNETCVNAGTLTVTGSLSSSSAVNVENTATLAGTGTVGSAASTTYVKTGGTIAPGSSANPNATFSIGGNVQFSSGSALNLNLSADGYIGNAQSGNTLNTTFINNSSNIITSTTTNDGLKVTGTVSLTSGMTLAVSLQSGYAPVAGDAFKLMDWSSVTLNGFTYGGSTQRTGGATDNASYDLDLPTLSAGLFWDVSNFNTNGVIGVVPEPGRGMLLTLAAAALILRRRSRKTAQA